MSPCPNTPPAKIIFMRYKYGPDNADDLLPDRMQLSVWGAARRISYFYFVLHIGALIISYILSAIFTAVKKQSTYCILCRSAKSDPTRADSVNCKCSPAVIS